MSMGSWDAIAAPLERAHRVMRCDFRGQLLSPGDPPGALEGHLHDVLSVLDAAGAARAHVVGTSFGALVGLLLAAHHPGRTASVVAITATDRVTPEIWEAARPLLAACRDAAEGGDGGRVFDLLLPGAYSPAFLTRSAPVLAERRQQVAALPRAWFQGLSGLLASLERLDLTPALGRIRCPALVVAAAEDLTFPLARSESLAAAIRGAGLEVVRGSGHALVVEQPERLLEIVQAFLARVGRGEGSS
jgi:3-oxoadipate enol-lactonase